jgi:uncharacterized protein YkwD
MLSLAVALSALVAGPAAGGHANAAATERSFQLSLLTAIDSARLQAGLSPVRESRALDAAAAAHSREMALTGSFSHESAGGRSFLARLRRFYQLRRSHPWRVGETLFWGTGKPGVAAVVHSWLASPEHRRILLDPAWQEIGVASASTADSAALFVTADFGSRN